MKPSKKSSEMEGWIDKLSNQMVGRTRTSSIRTNKCSWCGKDALEFRDKLSAKEYIISGFCQACQDDTFGK